MPGVYKVKLVRAV